MDYDCIHSNWRGFFRWNFPKIPFINYIMRSPPKGIDTQFFSSNLVVLGFLWIQETVSWYHSISATREFCGFLLPSLVISIREWWLHLFISEIWKFFFFFNCLLICLWLTAPLQVFFRSVWPMNDHCWSRWPLDRYKVIYPHSSDRIDPEEYRSDWRSIWMLLDYIGVSKQISCGAPLEFQIKLRFSYQGRPILLDFFSLDFWTSVGML